MDNKREETPFTIDELISTLNRSSLPTLIAEGRDDLIFLRKLEDTFQAHRLSILPTGGRSVVLQLFERRSELHSRQPIMFLADLDIWVCGDIPQIYQDQQILFTDGYSIENDLYRDGNIERLFSTQERVRFLEELERFIRWYALALSRHLKNSEERIAVHPGKVLDDENFFDNEIVLRPGETYPAELLSTISANYRKLLRGKSLLALALRQLSNSKRSVKHSGDTLMENASKPGDVYVKRIEDWIAVRVGSQFVGP